MDFNIEFRVCLKALLSTLDISANRLAKAINVDASLIYRWLNGERIPPYKSNYIEHISEYISGNIHNSIQENNVNKIITSIVSIDIESDMKINIKKALLEAQGYSSENRKKITRHKNENTTNILFNDLQKPKSFNIPFNGFLDNINVPLSNLSSYFDLSSEDKIIIGSIEILKTIMRLLENTPEHPSGDDDTIYISFNNDLGIPNNEEEFYNRIFRALIKLLVGGWKVVYLLRFTYDLNRTIGFIKSVQALIFSGRFYVHYYKDYDVFTAGKEFVIIPNLGALSCYTIFNNSTVNCAFYFKNINAIKVLQYYFKTVLDNYTLSLFNDIVASDKLGYYNIINQNSKNPGTHYIFSKFFQQLTIPTSLFKKLILTKELSVSEISSSITFNDKMHELLLENLKHNSRTDLYMIDTIDNLINEKKMYLYCNNEFEIFDVKTSDIIEHLEYIVHLLKTYEKYNIAFKNNVSSIDKYLINIFCVVEERKRIILEIHTTCKADDIYLSADEPMIMDATVEYMKQIHKAIAPVNKKKSEIIKLINNRIDMLKKTNY